MGEYISSYKSLYPLPVTYSSLHSNEISEPSHASRVVACSNSSMLAQKEVSHWAQNPILSTRTPQGAAHMDSRETGSHGRHKKQGSQESGISHLDCGDPIVLVIPFTLHLLHTKYPPAYIAFYAIHILNLNVH